MNWIKSLLGSQRKAYKFVNHLAWNNIQFYSRSDAATTITTATTGRGSSQGDLRNA